jgi:hypothetical protein
MWPPAVGEREGMEKDIVQLIMKRNETKELEMKNLRDGNDEKRWTRKRCLCSPSAYLGFNLAFGACLETKSAKPFHLEITGAVKVHHPSSQTALLAAFRTLQLSFGLLGGPRVMGF